MSYFMTSVLFYLVFYETVRACVYVWLCVVVRACVVVRVIVVVRECVCCGMKGWIKLKQEVQEQPDASERGMKKTARENSLGREGEEGGINYERLLLFGYIKFAVAYQEIVELYVCLKTWL